MVLRLAALSSVGCAVLSATQLGPSHDIPQLFDSGNNVQRFLDLKNFNLSSAELDGVSLHYSTFSRTVWRLYGGAQGLVMWY